MARAILALVLALPVAVAVRDLANIDLADTCSATLTDVNGKNVKYNLKAHVGSYSHGAANSDGAYNIQSDSTFTEYDYFFNICGDMSFTAANAPVCGTAAQPASNCPDVCKGPDNICGNQCAAMQSQKNTGSTTSYCWALGMWGNGAQANMTMLDPTNGNAGVNYVMMGGDNFGCPGTERQLTVKMSCPAKGRSGAAILPTTVTETSTCKYQTEMTHPAACPYSGKGGGGGGGGFGTPFLIVMFVTPAVYLMVGAGLNHRAGQVGVDLIPNLDFWRDVPGMFTDGVGVMVDGAKGLMGKAKGGDGGFSTIS